MSRRFARRRLPAVPLTPLHSSQEVCLEVTDHSISRRSAVQFFGLRGMRHPHAPAARMAEQFITQNRALTSQLDVRIDRDYDGNDVQLVIHAGNAVGAIPLVSPTTARPDFGLVVQPRFPWAGIGPMLAEMGWQISPVPLRLPLLRRSERRVPLWVLSSMILMRLRGLLDSLTRRFELTTENLHAPRGQVHWTEYATRNLPNAKFLSMPCTFPDLRDDRLLKGAIRHAIERQLHALETQKEHGAFIHKLIEFGQQLLRRVQGVPLYMPSSTHLAAWLRRPLRTEMFIDGLQAIEWTVEERGLAGVSDLEGIPWSMPMDRFFEAWVETVFRKIARQTGAQMKAGSKRETTYPIQWDPPYTGTQRSLAPDIWLEWDSMTLIVDAKYKRHWEELHHQSWWKAEESLRDQHRNDLLQVLAYANLARTPQVITCLAYPCTAESWASLQERGRLIHRADPAIGSRILQLWLTAVPMTATVDAVALPLISEVCKTATRVV